MDKLDAMNAFAKVVASGSYAEAAQILAILVALPVGVYAATRPYSIFDQIASTFALIGFSLPTFFTGLLFILLRALTGAQDRPARTMPSRAA